MPSVVAAWNGQCTDQQVQKALRRKMVGLGQLSCRMHSEFFNQPVHPVLFDGKRRVERALISNMLTYDFPEAAEVEAVREGIGLVRQVGLYGVAFKLFDPRHYNSSLMVSHTYDVSFVFIRSSNPHLDGQLVNVIPLVLQEKSNLGCPYFLDTPEIDLRYYLEKWMRRLLAWVKHFYLPGLEYWLYGDNPYSNIYDHYAPGNARARNKIFRDLCKSFVAQAESWKAYCLNRDANNNDPFAYYRIAIQNNIFLPTRSINPEESPGGDDFDPDDPDRDWLAGLGD